MRLVINPQNLFRHEFFGGLFHSRNDGTMMEISHEDAIFVWAIERLGDPVLASKVFCEVFPGSSYYPSIQPFLDEDLVVEVNNNPIYMEDIREVVIDGRKRLSEAKSRKYLRAPLSLSIYPSMVCNQNCRFCFIGSEKKCIKERESKKWVRLLSEAKDLGIPMISILGGEPTQYKGLLKILEQIEILGLKTNLTTNGTLISSEVMQQMKKSKKLTVCFSLQSLDQYHENWTGLPSMVVQRSIKQFVSDGNNCRVNTVYTGQSTDQILDLARFCLDNNVKKLSISVFNTCEKADTYSISRLRRVGETVKERLLGITGSEKLTFTIEGCLLYSAYPEIIDNPILTELDQLLNGCEAGQTILEVLPNGQVLPCILFPLSSRASGNIFESGIQDIWDNDILLNKIRSFRTKDPICKNCNFFNFCNGGCPSMQLAIHGKIGLKGDPNCEIRNRSEGRGNEQRKA